MARDFKWFKWAWRCGCSLLILNNIAQWHRNWFLWQSLNSFSYIFFKFSNWWWSFLHNSKCWSWSGGLLFVGLRSCKLSSSFCLHFSYQTLCWGSWSWWRCWLSYRGCYYCWSSFSQWLGFSLLLGCILSNLFTYRCKFSWLSRFCFCLIFFTVLNSEIKVWCSNRIFLFIFLIHYFINHRSSIVS